MSKTSSPQDRVGMFYQQMDWDAERCWTEDATDKIQRANLDGSNVEDLITTG